VCVLFIGTRFSNLYTTVDTTAEIAKIRVDSPDCGTTASTEIFLLYPVTGASINASVSQLSHMKPMTVPDVHTLVTLIGLYLSGASGHQKAYKELLAHVDDCHTITLDKVQNAIIRFSRSRSACAFALTCVCDTPAFTHNCPRFLSMTTTIGTIWVSMRNTTSLPPSSRATA
jgi:hypothetical protein